MATTAAERKVLLDGEWVSSGEWIEVASPYDGSPIARVAKVGAAEARSAVDAAERAMRDPLPAHERAAILDRVAVALAERTDEAARLICAEAGKPMKAARVEASRAVSTYTMAAVEARKLAGEVVPMDASQAGVGKLAFTQRVPVGVVGAISPFNFPLNLVAHKIAPALAAGCAVVLKPATQTPLSALFLAELEVEAGLPAGWLNVLVGPSAEIGDVLVEDPRVALITFTGSGPVGWKLRERAPKKRVNLELGNATPVFGTPQRVEGFRLVDARASYGIGLETFALGFPIHFDWAWRTLFNKPWEDLLFAASGGSSAFRKAQFAMWIGYDF